jgi:hypothetical protein
MVVIIIHGAFQVKQVDEVELSDKAHVDRTVDVIYSAVIETSGNAVNQVLSSSIDWAVRRDLVYLTTTSDSNSPSYSIAKQQVHQSTAHACMCNDKQVVCSSTVAHSGVRCHRMSTTYL